MRSPFRSSWRSLALAALVALSCAGGEAIALGADAASVGQQRFDEGVAALGKGDFEGARLSLLQAYAIDPQPRTLFELAVAEEKAGHPLDALSHARQYARTPGLGDDDRKAAADLVAEASTKVAHVRLDAPPSTTFSLDGAALAIVAPVPDPLDLPPGKHALEAHFHERTATTTVAPSAGETVVWQLQFETSPGAAQAAPAKPAAPPASVQPQEPPGYDTPSGKPRASSRWLAAAGFAAGGLATLAVMGGFLAAAANEETKWSSLDVTTGACPQPPATAQCQALKSAVDARASDDNVAIGFGAVGGVFVIAAIVSLVAWPEKPSKTAAGLVPVFTGHEAGALWVGSF
jgi:hypothetical protein